MGIESVFPPTTKLTRKDPQGDASDELIVTGIADSEIVVQSLVEFGSPYKLDTKIARREYLADVPPEARTRQPNFADSGRSPEEVFQEEERKFRESGKEPVSVPRGGRKPKVASDES